MQWALRCSAAVLALLLPAMAAHARPRHTRSWTESQFAAASQLQESLEARPAEQRTRHDYQRVIDSYRRIYMSAPISPKAEPSVVAAAEMTEEMGRRFHDPDILRSAVKQYGFLRREYPGSKFRFDALFRIGEIYKDDLHDKASADATFGEFLRLYPRNQFAQAARSALAEPAQQRAALNSKHAPTPSRRDAGKTATDLSDRVGNASDSDDGSTADSAAQNHPIKSDVASKEASAEEDSQNEAVTAPLDASGKPSRVLGIRHWSTPGYTHVAIDLERGVKFESQHIDNPDRVFFDLLNTQLDRNLAGKSFEVDDGLLKSVRVAQFKAGRSRIVLDLDNDSKFEASLHENPPRLIIDIHDKDSRNKGDLHLQAAKAPLTSNDVAAVDATEDDHLVITHVLRLPSDPGNPLAPASASIKKPVNRKVGGDNGVKKTVVVEDDDVTTTPLSAKLESPQTKPLTVAGIPETSLRASNESGKIKRKTPVADLDVREAQPNASGDRSLIRALGLKIGKIVIDPGHGGHDTGTIGPNGLEEKDLVLDVSRRLGKLLQGRLGAEVIYTRKDDTFIPLETRTAIANQQSADLFVSVHANSSHDPDARGVETYYLNFTSSPEALEVAARENAVSEKSIHELQDLVKKIALREKIEESHEFASDVQNSLHTGLAVKNPGLRDRGVKKAPFIVLIGANMPSILAEISFVSNPGDEHRLESPDYRQKIAESLYRGIAKYVSGLSGVKVASKIDKDEGQ
jgi:N-acetylmuramoyl-L-alanine amidase